MGRYDKELLVIVQGARVPSGMVILIHKPKDLSSLDQSVSFRFKFGMVGDFTAEVSGSNGKEPCAQQTVEFPKPHLRSTLEAIKRGGGPFNLENPGERSVAINIGRRNGRPQRESPSTELWFVREAKDLERRRGLVSVAFGARPPQTHVLLSVSVLRSSFRITVRLG